MEEICIDTDIQVSSARLHWTSVRATSGETTTNVYWYTLV